MSFRSDDNKATPPASKASSPRASSGSPEPEATAPTDEPVSASSNAPSHAGKRMATGSTSPVETGESDQERRSAPADVRLGAPHTAGDSAPELPVNEHPAEAHAVSPYDEELARLLRISAWLGQGADGSEPYASFTSMFLAFLATRGSFCSWVQAKVDWIGPAMEDVIRRWRVRAPEVHGLDAERVKQAARLADRELPASYGLSPSATALLERARELAAQLGDQGPLAARHLLAAFLYQLENLRDLEAWKLDREGWASRLLCYAIDLYPDRAAAWQALHDRHFPRPNAASLAMALRRASALAADEATELDAELLLEGILRHGLADAKKASSAWKLVSQIGAGIEALELEPLDDETLPEKPLSLGPELLPIFARARVFATATRIPHAVNSEDSRCGFLAIRHVVASILTDSRPLPAFELLRRAGRTEGGVLAQFRQWLCAIGPGNDDCEIWKELFAEHRDEVQAGYDKGEDRLGIDRDVRALAAVLASTKVTPPLSVGLFGDWGSGKSFFMGKLRERIEQLAAAAARGKPEEESWFCGKQGAVVQIDFNAWHYMDADLWSSLAVRVFDALSASLNEQFIQACRENITALREREAKLHSEKTQVTEAQAALEKLLAEQREARAVREVRLGELAKRLAEEQLRKIKEQPEVVKVTAELKLEGNNVKRELGRAQRDLQYIGGRAEIWWRTLGSPARAITLLMVLGMPALIGALVSAYQHAGTTIVAAVAAYGGALSLLFTRVRGFATKVAGYVDAAVSEVVRIEQAVRDHKSPEELGLEAERDSSSARIAELEREQLMLAKRKTELEAELAALQRSDAKSLREFILERAAAQDYRKNLGVISAIHHDFTQLARFLAPSANGPNVERIVLYIDDLDRCPPKRVVEVLQAIHIILSLPLFVVVVGVDSRWLLDSLTAFYREQFPKDAVALDVARPQQYLEKIFQVPYTLTPMTDEGYSSLVAAMLGAASAGEGAQPEAGRAAAARAGDEAGVSAGGVRRAPTASEAASGRRTTATRAVARPQRVSAQRRRASGDAIDLMPQSLRLEPEELIHLQSLARLVPTPRSAKRLVNLYRIVRASLEDDELTDLLHGRYRLLQICLALVIGYPSFGAELFSQILSGRVSGRTQLQGWLKRRGEKAEDGIDVREIAALSVLHENSGEFQSWEIVETTVRRVGRFSFETGRTLALHAALVRNAAAAAAQAE